VIDGHEEVFEAIHRGILALFVVELVTRLKAGGWRYLRRSWHAFDATVISSWPAYQRVAGAAVRDGEIAR